MLLMLVLLLATDNLLAKPSCGFGYEFFEHRLEQLQLDQLNGFSELNSTLQTQSSLLERLVSGLTLMIDHQIKHKKRIIESCEEVSRPGRYRLQLPNRSSTSPPPPPVTVLCESNEPYDGGSWLVIQHRFDGSVDFNRSWSEYRDGFGIVEKSSEFWLGLETVHQLTKNGDFELLIQLRNENGAYGFGRYQKFVVYGEDQGYRLAPLVGFSGTIFNRLNFSRDEQFSTYDRDLDKLDEGNCAHIHGGGWWFHQCGWTTLNGPFNYNGETDGRGIYWEDWTKAATYSRMMIRRK